MNRINTIDDAIAVLSFNCKKTKIASRTKGSMSERYMSANPISHPVHPVHPC